MTEPTYIKPTSKTRNLNCPCGSGLKLKKCCADVRHLRAWKVWDARRKYQAYMDRFAKLFPDRITVTTDEHGHKHYAVKNKSVVDSEQAIYGFAKPKKSATGMAAIAGVIAINSESNNQINIKS